ncbi:hypothetical protein [Acetobacter vaccinii]|uniref:hypothetical protein n=1 Tax=Acetobacter vaccinii TaxID=2592655 RepID=UPI001FEF85E1|nr:hypothetical protein [Acetobacter vaccinii]
MLSGIFDFAQEIGNAMGWVLPALCYIVGSTFLLGAVFSLYKASSGSGTVLSFGVPAALLTGAAICLSFPEFINTGSRTLGFSAGASFTDSSGKVSFSENTLTTAMAAGPAETLKAVLHLFRFYFMNYGALIVFFAVTRQIGRAKGTNNSSASSNIMMIVGGFLIMNADTIVPALATKLHLVSS